MYRIELVQGDKVLFAGRWKETEEAKQDLVYFEVAINEATENKISSITVTNSNGLPTIIPKNILMGSLITLTEDAENEKE